MTDDAMTPVPADHREAPLRRYHAGWHRALRYVAQRLVLRPVVGAVTTTRVHGQDNLDGLDGAFVLIANHNSHLDTAAIVARLPYRVVKHLAVGAAADYFYGRWWIKAATSLFFNTYPIARTTSARSRGKGISWRLVREGVPVMLFPEGTRSRNGEMRPFKPGAAALSITANVPCLPIALLGTHEAMPVGRAWPAPGRPAVQILIGRPMRALPGERPREFSDRIAARIQTMMTMQTPYVLDDGATPRTGESGTTQEEAS